MSALAAWLLAATSLGMSWTASESAGQSTPRSDEPVVTATIVAPLSSSAGSVSAGLACFPSGKLRISDFVHSEPAFRDAVEYTFLRDQTGPHIAPKGVFSVSLKSIESHLCAKGFGIFGMGDKRSMSGETNFAFDWAYQVGTSNRRIGSAIVSIKLKKSEARTVDAIMVLALASLRQQIFTSTTDR